jgi:hypothetical protein
MTWIIRRFLILETIAATHLTVIGHIWATSAMRRLGKFSGNRSGGLK